jgi:hypothetical protein
LPAWLRLLGGASLVLLAIRVLVLYIEGRSFNREFGRLLKGRVIEQASEKRNAVIRGSH